jgi:hypothetical protein
MVRRALGKQGRDRGEVWFLVTLQSAIHSVLFSGKAVLIFLC